MFKSFVTDMLHFLPTEPKRGPEGPPEGESSVKKQRELSTEEKHLERLMKYFRGLEKKMVDKTNEYYIELQPLLERAAAAVNNSANFWYIMLEFQALLNELDSEDSDVLAKINKLIKWSTIPDEIEQRLATAERLEAEAEVARLEAEAARLKAETEAEALRAAQLEARRKAREAERKAQEAAEAEEAIAAPAEDAPEFGSGEEKESSSVRQRYWRPKAGEDVMVQLVDWKTIPKDYQKKSFYKELKKKMEENGPVRLTIEQVGAGTYTFIRKISKQGKSISGELRIDDVLLEPAEDVETSDKLEDGMLIEVQYEGDPVWYLLRYRVLTNADGTSRYVVTEDVQLPDNSQIYEFNEDDDDWRFPEYMSLAEDDVVECFIDDTWQKVTITERLDEHNWMCEFNPLRSKKRAENEIEIDMYRTRIRVPQSKVNSSESEEYSESEEDSDDDRAYRVEESVDYHGITYVITSYDKESEKYTLTPKKDGPSIELTEDDIDNQWSHEFDVNDEILYQGRRAEIKGIDWSQKAYVVEDADGEEHVTPDVQAYTPLAYEIGRHVVYGFRYCEIVDLDEINLRYTLESGDVQFEDISEDDLSEWCILQEPKKDPIIYKIARRLEKSVKRGGKSVKVPYYKLLSEEESEKKKPKLKDAVATDTGNVKKQEEVEAIYKDLEAGVDEDMGAIFEYSASDRVSFNGKAATIVGPSGEDRYEILVDGESSTQVVDDSDLMILQPEVEDKPEVDLRRYEVGDYLYDNGDMWMVKFIVNGRLEWEVVEPNDGAEIEDFEGTLWEYSEEFGWRMPYDSPNDDTDEEDAEPEYTYDIGDIVTLDDEAEVFIITGRAGGVYTIESVSSAENTLENIAEDRLIGWEPEFEAGNEVVVGDSYEKRVIDEVGDGLYILDDGTEVAESDLSEYIEPIGTNTIVKVSGRRELYRVQSFNAGMYQLVRLIDGEALEVGVDEVDEREEPEFNEKDWVVVSGEDNPRQVKKVNAQKGTYKLSDNQEYFESQLQDAPDPKFGRFNGEKFVPDAEQLVSVRDEGVPYKIKKILRETREYVLEDGRKIHEDALREYVQDDEDDL